MGAATSKRARALSTTKVIMATIQNKPIAPLKRVEYERIHTGRLGGVSLWSTYGRISSANSTEKF